MIHKIKHFIIGHRRLTEGIAELVLLSFAVSLFYFVFKYYEIKSEYHEIVSAYHAFLTLDESEINDEYNIGLAQLREPRIYAAFGDSVSAGYGLVRTEDRHTSVLYDMLAEKGIVNEYINMAVSGYTTAMVLELLNDLGSDETDNLQKAEIITLNIGGNNILIPFVEYLPNVLEAVFEARDYISGSWAIISEAMELISEGQIVFGSFNDSIESGFTSLPSLSSTRELISFLQRLSPALEDIEDVFSDAASLDLIKIISVLSGSFTVELEAKLTRGVESFAAEFGEIIHWLKANAPNAVIIVNTVYNPIPQQIIDVPLEISGIADGYIRAINEIILDESETSGFLVADVYAAFAGKQEMLNANYDASTGYISVDFIHPSAEGHKTIAQIHYDVYNSIR
jgi:lysophospholipase L1-like esterase